jgi:catalase
LRVLGEFGPMGLSQVSGVPEQIVQRQLVHFHKADPRYAEGVAKALGVKNAAA